MSLIEFPINLDRVATALERIADALDRAYPAIRPLLGDDEPTGELITATNEDAVRWEQEEEHQMENQ